MGIITKEEVAKIADKLVRQHYELEYPDDEEQMDYVENAMIDHSILTVRKIKKALQDLYLLCKDEESKDMIGVENIKLSHVKQELESRRE